MMYTTREWNKDKFMRRNPELIGTVAGIQFYEHPIMGDECPLVAIQGEHCGLTEFYELPTHDDIEQASINTSA